MIAWVIAWVFCVNMADEKHSNPNARRKPGIKNFLTSPYSLTWPKLDKGDNKNILDGIRSIFPTNGLKREKTEEFTISESQFISWDQIKKDLVIGINSVTKSLEKDNLLLVLVCRSTKPAILTNHLMLLSATRSTPCCAVFGLSDVMAPLLGIKTVVACAFKKSITVKILKDLVEYIVCKIPPLPEEYVATWHSNALHSSQKTLDQKEILETCENKPQSGGGKDENVLSKQDEHTSVIQGKKRTLDATYVQTKIKTLQPRETPKVKRKKLKRKHKQDACSGVQSAC